MGGEEMDQLVAELGNKIVKNGRWPQALKQAAVCPIPKETTKVDIIDDTETQPISLLEFLDKWLQKMIYNRIQKNLNYHKSQAGYTLSCDHHTALVSDFVMNNYEGEDTLALFTDISKAFDSVPHPELIEGIWNSEISSAYKWVISSIIENRHYQVVIKEAKGRVASSKWRKMVYGTP